jgi:hypothetical protein
MKETWSLFSVGVLAVCLSLTAVSAQAWELELTGGFNWTHEWYTQCGSKGFFGPYNQDNGGGTRVANLNFWNGGQFDSNITTSSQAAWSYFNVEFLTKIKVNEAIRLQGKYRLGTYGNPMASDYHTFDAPGTNNAFSEGQWTMFWATVQTPTGTLGIGKRPWTFGTGLQYDGEDAATTESVALVAPYGPFDLGVAFYPYRFAGSSSIGVYKGYDPFLGRSVPFDPFDLPRLAGTDVPYQYFSRADSSGALGRDFLLFMNYHNGSLNMGVSGSFLSYHIGPEAVLQNDVNATPPAALDAEVFHGTAYVKFNNGRVFLNAEGAWLYWTDRWSGPVGRLLETAPHNARYTEQWRYMLELGMLAGPARISLLNAWTPGPDRRAGALVRKQSAAFVNHPTFDRMHGNFDVFRPYSYLFAYNYGAGLGAYNLSGNGYLRDASVLAARLDYAVAANLNVFGSFFYANRTSNGYSWGCIRPNMSAGDAHNERDGNININLNRYPTSPNIPDTALGYEIDLGFDWKLLEGLTGGILAGYWQPGKWFNYACIDRSVPNWQDAGASYFGTRPDRTLDPIIGGNFYLKCEF